MNKLTLLLVLGFFCGNAFAVGNCNVAAGTFGYERAVSVGKTTTYFRPYLQLDNNDRARLVVLAMTDEATPTGFCKAMGHLKGTVGSRERSDEIPYTFLIDQSGEVMGIYTACRNDCDDVVNTVTCLRSP